MVMPLDQREPMRIQQLRNILEVTQAPCLTLHDRVAIVSSTNPSATWIVSFSYDQDRGLQMHCSCPAWRFQKAETWDRECKHTIKVWNVLHDGLLRHQTVNWMGGLFDLDGSRPLADAMAGGGNTETTFCLPDYGDLGI